MKKRKIKVSAVIFDMDGVITNTMPDHFRVWTRIFKEEGIHVSHLDVYSREGQKGITSVKEIFALNQKPFDEAHARAILAKKERIFKTIVKTRFIPGARSFLRFLHKNKFKLALVTGTSRHELHRILPDAIYTLFDVVVTGSDVKHGKPHPEPYLKALKKLSIKPGGALVIENAPFGIQSAKSSGMKCFAVETSLPKKYLKGADGIFHGIADLREKVDFVLS